MKITFRDRVRKVVKRIPKGKTLSYKQVAMKAGSPKAYRAVANIMSKNFDAEVPCHRVICDNGSLGGYNRGGTKAKQAILEKEGAIITTR
jgi:O-6-methylguanine DNA methyltransferase